MTPKELRELRTAINILSCLLQRYGPGGRHGWQHEEQDARSRMTLQERAQDDQWLKEQGR